MHTTVLSALLLLAWAVPGRTAMLLAQDSAQVKEANQILGEWLTEEGTSKIEIYKEGEEFAGRISWLKEPEADGKPKVDEKNPEERLRSRPLMGLTIMHGFVYDGDNEWKGGKIYDPKSGNDYSAKMTLVDEHTLNLRGYVLVPLLGRTSKWTR